MSTAITNAAFLEHLHRSAVLDEPQFRELLVELEQTGLGYADGMAVARHCIRQGYLTPFQAQQLLKGKWRNFIVNGKYLVLEPIGSGGMGAVYRCRHLALHKDVALKVMPQTLTNDPAALERFLREAHALASLNHVNIVQAHDCDEHGGQYYLVMSYVDGITLQQLVEKAGPLPVPRAAHYLAQACRGMQHAHEAGWMHRDLKPANLLIDHTDTLKILDLGLARLLNDTEGQITKKYDDKGMLGSPDYISPEQSLSIADLDIRADIYSLGATFYYLLAGRAPFEGLQVIQKLMAHQMTEPEDVGLFRNDIPAELKAVLRRMMAKDRNRRYDDPGGVADALAPWAAQYRPAAENLPPSSRRSSNSMRFRATVLPREADTVVSSPSGRSPVAAGDWTAVDWAPTDPTLTDVPLEREAAPPPASRKRWWMVLGGAAAAVLLAGGLLLGFLGAGELDVEAQLARADAHCEARHWKSAAEIYTELLDRLPEDAPDRQTVLARLKQWNHVLLLVAERRADDIPLRIQAARFLMATREWQRAWKSFSGLGSAAPAQDDVYWRDRGRAAVHAGELRDAVLSLEKAVQLKPENSGRWRDLATVAAAAGETDLYRRVCVDMLGRFGTSGNMHQYAEIAIACVQAPLPRDLLDKVAELVAQSVEAGPAIGWYHLAHGMVQYRRGQFQACRDAMRKAREAEPQWSSLKLTDVGELLALQHGGPRAEAEKALNDLEEWLAGQNHKYPGQRYGCLTIWWDAVMLETLLAEARAAMKR